jgi:hypothetical protein
MLLLGTSPGWAQQAEGGEPAADAPPQAVETGEPADDEAAAREEILKSDAMLEALIWWDRYYAAAAGDHEQKLQELEDRIAKMSVMELRKFLMEFQLDRERDRQRKAVSDRNRQQVAAFYSRQQQAAQQLAPKGTRRGGRPYFGTTGNYYRASSQAPRRRYYVVRPPMITSLSVARYSIYRSIFGRRW